MKDVTIRSLLIFLKKRNFCLRLSAVSGHVVIGHESIPGDEWT